jgi:hypothetical protein
MCIGKAWRFRKDLSDQWIRQNTEASVEDYGENVGLSFYWVFSLELS